jgi:hypothetical protein
VVLWPFKSLYILSHLLSRSRSSIFIFFFPRVDLDVNNKYPAPFYRLSSLLYYRLLTYPRRLSLSPTLASRHLRLQLQQCIVMKDRETGRSRGFGFVVRTPSSLVPLFPFRTIRCSIPRPPIHHVCFSNLCIFPSPFFLPIMSSASSNHRTVANDVLKLLSSYISRPTPTQLRPMLLSPA